MADSNSPVPKQKSQTLRDQLGDLADRLTSKAVEVASNGDDVEQELNGEMDKWVCALHPEQLAWRWYNQHTGEWGAACTPQE